MGIHNKNGFAQQRVASIYLRSFCYFIFGSWYFYRYLKLFISWLHANLTRVDCAEYVGEENAIAVLFLDQSAAREDHSYRSAEGLLIHPSFTLTGASS